MKEITLTEDQEYASQEFTKFLLDKDSKYFIIRGSAGTGKTTLVKHLIETIKPRLQLYSLLLNNEKVEYSIELVATTNKAAAVLGELSNTKCVTLHSRLGLIPKENYQTGEMDFIRGRNYTNIYNTILIIDECSFVSDELFAHLDHATKNCKVILIGDPYQLAPVKQDIPVMDSVEGVNVSLEKIMRHGGIIAHTGAKYREAVKTGEFSPITVDGKVIQHVNGPTFQQMIHDTFTSPDFSENSAKVLAWLNETVNKYNMYIRSVRGQSNLFNETDVLTTNRPIIIGKNVIANTEDVVKIHPCDEFIEEYGVEGRNATIGNYTYKFFLPNDTVQAAKVIKSFKLKKQWHTYFEILNNWLDLRPSFASTVHKAQGSTYDKVFINLSDIGRCRNPSDVARMMYVAITRASKQVILYGTLPPVYQGVLNVKENIAA